MPEIKEIIATTAPYTTLEGAGVPISRILPSPDVEFDLLDPFLLLDEVDLPADFNEAFPTHPHRGFEIITYLLSGAAQHTDDQGHTEVVSEGDVQKITAGKGISHGEGPVKNKGFHGLQLWVNLSKVNKQIPPHYQFIHADEFPLKNGVKTIVGPGSPIKLHTSTMYYDITFDKPGDYQSAVPEGFNTIVYVMKGKIHAGERTIAAGEVAIFGEGKKLKITGDANTRLIFLAGQPLREEVIWMGPFVD